MLAAFIPTNGRIRHTLIVATAAIGAGVAGAALKIIAAEGCDAAISLAADVLFLDVEDREYRIEVVTRRTVQGEVGLGLAARDKTAESGQPQQGVREGRTQPHGVRMR